MGNHRPPLEASALQHAGAAGLHGRSPLLRLQSDERLVALIRRGNHHAFEALVARYQSRLLAFCRHMLSSREDAEDVLQEVFAAAFNAMLADEREINVRPWLYRIARNRSLNHLRRTQAVGMDSMDVHLSEGGLTTADKVHKREEFRLLIADVQDLPETQRTALLLREIDALSYEQIAEAMETTVPSVKSLLVRARVSLAEAAEARLLSCEEVRLELGEVAEGLRAHERAGRAATCARAIAARRSRSTCAQNNKALAALFPLGPLLLLKKVFIAHLGTTAAAGGSGAAAASAGGGAGAALQVGFGTVASKAVAGLAAAAIVTAGAVEVQHAAKPRTAPAAVVAQVKPKHATPAATAAPTTAPVAVDSGPQPVEPVHMVRARREVKAPVKTAEAEEDRRPRRRPRRRPPRRPRPLRRRRPPRPPRARTAATPRRSRRTRSAPPRPAAAPTRRRRRRRPLPPARCSRSRPPSRARSRRAPRRRRPRRRRRRARRRPPRRRPPFPRSRPTPTPSVEAPSPFGDSPGSVNPRAERHVGVGREQDHSARLV